MYVRERLQAGIMEQLRRYEHTNITIVIVNTSWASLGVR